MYKNILITGSSGFIGKHLVNRLEKLGFNVLKFTRKNSEDELATLVKKADFIFHLAGEVRPNSSDQDFNKSNFQLSQKIIELIKNLQKNVPILMTSTVHAINPKNAYGVSKKQAEDALLNFGKENGIKVYIYRLPHVFGEGCKPNYNSVISTWIFNVLHDLEINIYDRNISMRYIYVQDFIDQVIRLLFDDEVEGIREVEEIYSTTLGQVYDLILYFGRSADQNDVYEFIGDDEFAKKLFRVFLDYKKHK